RLKVTEEEPPVQKVAVGKRIANVGRQARVDERVAQQAELARRGAAARGETCIVQKRAGTATGCTRQPTELDRGSTEQLQVDLCTIRHRIELEPEPSRRVTAVHLRDE